MSVTDGDSGWGAAAERYRRVVEAQKAEGRRIAEEREAERAATPPVTPPVAPIDVEGA